MVEWELFVLFISCTWTVIIVSSLEVLKYDSKLMDSSSLLVNSLWYIADREFDSSDGKCTAISSLSYGSIESSLALVSVFLSMLTWEGDANSLYNLETCGWCKVSSFERYHRNSRWRSRIFIIDISLFNFCNHWLEGWRSDLLNSRFELEDRWWADLWRWDGSLLRRFCGWWCIVMVGRSQVLDVVFQN